MMRLSNPLIRCASSAANADPPGSRESVEAFPNPPHSLRIERAARYERETGRQ